MPVYRCRVRYSVRQDFLSEFLVTASSLDKAKRIAVVSPRVEVYETVEGGDTVRPLRVSAKKADRKDLRRLKERKHIRGT